MPTKMSFDGLHDFIAKARQEVEAVLRELSEVQFQFVSAHQESKAQHDATLNELSAQAALAMDALPADARKAIDERVGLERDLLEKRRQELLTSTVPKAETMADDLLTQAQRATDKVRKLNPQLDAREERLKAERAQMEAELKRLNAEIKRLSGCLTIFINFFKVGQLDKQRHKLMGQMEANARELQEVRQEWAKSSTDYQAEQVKLQQQWQQASVEAAGAREELAQLNDDDKRAQLALRRAIFYVFDNWKTPLPAGSNPLVEEINRMVQLNIRTDEYQEGLGKVAGLIALLGGVSQGLQSVDQSVAALMSEQSMHSAYLSPVDVQVDEEVLQFNARWDGLRSKVKDEKALGKQPAQFSALFDSELGGWLAEKNIKRMFDLMGGSLTAATQDWKG